MSKHTPGPWEIVETVNPTMIPDYHIRIGEEQINIFPYKRTYSEDGTQSGLVYDGGKLANANLIAAAPDLLEALVKLCDYANDSNDCQYGTLSTSLVLDIAEAAINKARGEGSDNR